MYPEIIIYAKSDPSQKVILQDCEIVKEDSASIDQGGGIDESGISSGSITIQIDSDSWDKCIALNDTLLISVDQLFGGKIDMQSIEKDIDKRLVKLDAYGWLDYAENINNLTEVYLDRRRWGSNGELRGAIPIFFSNLESTWTASYREKNRKIKFLKNDEYKTKKASVLEGEHTIQQLQKKDDKWGYLLNDVPEAPEITWVGSFGGITESTIFWRAVVRIPKMFDYMIRDYESGAKITVYGTDDYDGDYTFRYVKDAGLYKYLILDEQFRGSEKAQPTGWLSCHVGAKIWQHKGIRFEVSERWDVNINIEVFIKKCLTQLGIPQAGQHVDIAMGSEGSDTDFSLVARGFDKEVYIDHSEKRTTMCVYEDLVWFGVYALSLYHCGVGMFYSSKREFLYAFNGESSDYKTIDKWYGLGYHNHGDWEISQIFQINSTELWVVLDLYGSWTTEREHAVICLDITDKDDIYCKAIGDHVDCIAQTSQFGKGSDSLWQRNSDGKNYIVSLYMQEVGGSVFEYIRFVNLNNYHYDSISLLWSDSSILSNWSDIARGAIESTAETYLVNRWYTKKIYEIDLAASIGQITATYIEHDYADEIHSVCAAQGESIFFLNNRWGTMLRIVVGDGFYSYLQNAEGAIGYSAIKPGVGSVEKRFYAIEHADTSRTERTNLIIYNIDGSTAQQMPIPGVYAAYGDWGTYPDNKNLYTFVFADNEAALAQLGTFQAILYRPDFSGQNLREILVNLADMCNCWVWIKWDRSEAYFYSKKKKQNVVNLTDSEIIGTPNLKPYMQSEVDYIDMGEWSYPDYEAYPWTGEIIQTHSVFGDYITNALLAESIGKNWKEWLDRYIGELSIDVNFNAEIRTGTRISWNGAYWLVLNVSIDIIKWTMHLECIGYRGEETA